MNLSSFGLTGIVCLAVLASLKGASAQTGTLFKCLSVSPVEWQTESLFQCLSVFPMEHATLRYSSPPQFIPVSTPFHCQRIPSEPHLQGCLFERTGRYVLRRVGSDFRNLYSCDMALNYGVALAGGAVLANTSLDQHFSEWYQKDVRSSGTDDSAKFWKYFGEATVWVPIFAVTAVSYRFYEQSNWNKRNERCLLGEYAARTTRGYLVGVPALWTFQSLLGSERPVQGNEKGSYWHPFHADKGVSGHAFIGAMPFITAAQMVENPWVKGVFYAGSLLPAWSRVNDDAHYLSQVILGWYLAYLSARAVSQTEGTCLPRGLTIFPITQGRYVGLGVLYKR